VRLGQRFGAALAQTIPAAAAAFVHGRLMPFRDSGLVTRVSPLAAPPHVLFARRFSAAQ
jgi:hypothetical protein